MSIPLILKQDILPGRLIIVDASEDHDSVKAEVAQISEGFGFKNTIVLESDAASLTRQRNIGLQLVEAPIVMFPDDDSMWHRGFARNVLKVYEADVRRQVGGVSGLPVAEPPPELEQPLYKKSALGSVKAAIQPYRGLFEKHYFPKPLDLIGLATWTENIDVVDDINSRRVPHITGFRMSFRTDVIRQLGFDETLGYGAGYSYHEDFDASLGIERLGYALVSAERAKVCHYLFPGKRSGGYSADIEIRTRAGLSFARSKSARNLERVPQSKPCSSGSREDSQDRGVFRLTADGYKRAQDALAA
jgi:hypothetical protein